MRILCGVLVLCFVVACRGALGQGMPAPGYGYVGVGQSVPAYASGDAASFDGSPNPPPANGQRMAIPPAPGQPLGQYGENPALIPGPAMPGPGTSGPMMPGPDMPPPGAGMPMLSPQASPRQPPLEYATPKIVDPKPAEPPPKIWEASFEFGMDGTEGNSKNFNFHVGSKIKRKSAENTLTSEFAYHQNSSNSNETANAGLQEARAEHSLGDSPWTCFIHDRLDYDEFTSYRFRVSLDAGFGYQFIKNDATSLIGRFGGGTSKDFQGPNTDFVPELVFGMEAEHKLSKRQKLTSSVEYRPDISDFNNFRVVSKAGWEILLDEDMHLSLKLGLLDRYDSNSGTKKPNDLDYCATMLWSF